MTDEKREQLRQELQEKCGVYFWGDEIDIMLRTVEKYIKQPQDYAREAKRARAEDCGLPFKGEAFEREIDHNALTKGFYKVFKFMVENPGWHLDSEISAKTDVYLPSVERYKRYMRSAEFGSHTVERRRREGFRAFEYRLIPNSESKIYQATL